MKLQHIKKVLSVAKVDLKLGGVRGIGIGIDDRVAQAIADAFEHVNLDVVVTITYMTLSNGKRKTMLTLSPMGAGAMVEVGGKEFFLPKAMKEFVAACKKVMSAPLSNLEEVRKELSELHKEYKEIKEKKTELRMALVRKVKDSFDLDRNDRNEELGGMLGSINENGTVTFYNKGVQTVQRVDKALENEIKKVSKVERKIEEQLKDMEPRIAELRKISEYADIDEWSIRHPHD